MFTRHGGRVVGWWWVGGGFGGGALIGGARYVGGLVMYPLYLSFGRSSTLGEHSQSRLASSRIIFGGDSRSGSTIMKAL
jgi:hypothetical protein